MPTTPDVDVVSKLDTLSTWVKGTNLFEGPVRAKDTGVPQLACFVLSSGGAGPTPYADGTATNLRYSEVQVVVRSALRAFSAAQTLAREIRNTLHCAPPTGYLECRALQSEPIYLGEDEPGAHVFSVNFELVYEA